MRRMLAAVALLAVLALESFAACPPEAVEARRPQDRPTPYPSRAEDWPGHGAIRVYPWMYDDRLRFWKQRARSARAVVFAGDSLIARWRTLSADLPDMRSANRGIGGDTTRGLLLRFREDVLDLNPRAIVLLIGTNDLSAGQATEQSMSNIECMLAMVRRRSPETPVLLSNLPPRDSPQWPIAQDRLHDFNRMLTELVANRSNVYLVDLHTALSTAAGHLRAEAFDADRLHLSRAGYADFGGAVAAALRRATSPAAR